jgi:hypothetical protein
MGTGVSLAPWAPTQMRQNLRFFLIAPGRGMNPPTRAALFPFISKGRCSIHDAVNMTAYAVTLQMNNFQTR